MGLEEQFRNVDKMCSIKREYLRREFEMLKMKDSYTIGIYYGRIEESVNQIKLYEEIVTDKIW